ncbi:MAG: methyltransferase domain-containing protein [Nitrospira sp.]
MTDVRGCLFCHAPLGMTFVDLGMHPLCESFVPPERINSMEPFYPLHVLVCDRCFLVQLHEYVKPDEIFTEYAYFSSYSDSWVQHAKRYQEMICRRFGLSPESFVVELASNDGYLLQHFVAAGIPVLGIEPAANVGEVARQKNIPTLIKFFGKDTAQLLRAEGKTADLIVGNNVLAQVPDINDFVAGIKILLAPAGVMTIEFPHLMKLMQENQFDTIYHEHFFYFTLMTAERIFAAHGVRLFDVEELPTHGGSLRIYGCHGEYAGNETTTRYRALIDHEKTVALDQLDTYAAFSEQVKETKRKLLEFLIQAKRKGKTVVGYGAPGKGNTLLNYCGIRTDFVDYTVDRNPYKQGKVLPGTHIPIHHPGKIRETKPDYVLILPWNIRDEIMEQLCWIREWGGQFVVPIPEVRVYS